MKNKGRFLLLAITIAGWFALAAQLYLIIENRNASVPETIIRYFSFFTILTNLIVTIVCTLLLFSRQPGLFKFLLKWNKITAVAVYITVVGLVYNAILRFLWQPTGLQWVVDELLHTAIPILFILVWFTTPKEKISPKSVLAWLLYPLFYLICVLWRGAFSKFYPYPFIDVNVLGFNKVLINSTGMLFAFLFIAFLFFLLNRFKTNPVSNTSTNKT